MCYYLKIRTQNSFRCINYVLVSSCVKQVSVFCRYKENENNNTGIEHLSKTGTTPTTTCYYFLFKTYGSAISTMSHKGKEIPLLQSLFKYNTQEYHYVIKKLVVEYMLRNHKMPSPPHHFMHYSFIFCNVRSNHPYLHSMISSNLHT